MPRLSSRSKHEEFESNSTLQIIIKRKEGEEADKEEKQRISHHSAKISHHDAKISHWCEISISCALFKFPALFMFPDFDFLTPFSPFLPFMYKCELRVFLYFSYESFI